MVDLSFGSGHSGCLSFGQFALKPANTLEHWKMRKDGNSFGVFFCYQKERKGGNRMRKIKETLLVKMEKSSAK